MDLIFLNNSISYISEMGIIKEKKIDGLLGSETLVSIIVSKKISVYGQY